MDEAGSPIHPDVESLAFLLGHWHGTGRGDYPTIAAFRYREETTFAHVGKPFVAYTQRTWALDDGRPLHSESGYLRPQPAGRVELVLALPSGIVEIEVGMVAGESIDLASSLVAGTASAKEVTAVRRRLEVADDVLRYLTDMAAVGEELQFHLEGELQLTKARPG